MSKNKIFNLVSGCIAIAFSAGVWYVSSSFPEDRNVTINSDFFPKILAAALILSSLCMMATTLFGKKEETFGTISLKDKGVQRSLLCLVATILCAVLMTSLSFIIAGALYIFAIMVLLGYRKWIPMVLISAAVSIGIFLIFRHLLGITLPLGILRPLFY